MKRTFLLLFSLFSLVSLQAENKVSLTLIPPGKITNKVDLDIRGGIVNESASQQTYQVALYWNKENKDALLYETVVTIPAGKAETVKVVIPTKDRVGKNKVIFKVANEGKAYRKTKDIEVIESDIRSIQQISGAWTGIYHWSEIEGKHWNQDIKKMTDDQWRELIRSMNKLEMNMVVIQEVFRNEEYVGKHTTNVDNYVGKAFYPSKLYPGRMELTAEDPIEAILTEADKQGMNVLMGVGMFAWFDFTPESLEWHKRVAKELWDMYGHHESFYAFYVSEESGGGLDNWEQRPEMRKKRKDDIVNFFKEFKAYCNGLARMPDGDLTGKEAANMLQKVCDEAKAHLWFDLEVFLFNPDNSLYPRPVEEIIRDLNLFDNFEKILCYQFPGVFNDPKMSIRVGEARTIDLFNGYMKYLKELKAKNKKHK